MTKIFKRETLDSNIARNKNVKKNRKRDIIVNFRMSKEEKILLDNRIELSGMLRQEFFIQSCLNQKIVTYGNIRTFDAMKNKIKIIEEHLAKVSITGDVDIEVLESLRTILEILDGLKRKGELDG